MGANDEQGQFWTELAPTWLELADQLEQVSERPGQLAMDRLQLASGQRVLDVGCGTGHTTIQLARRVAPEGTAVGLDIAAPMLEGARQRAADSGVSNVEFVQADAQVHDFEPGSYDRAYSRFGVMFFSDPDAAFANIGQALGESGVLSFACWQEVFANEWMFVPAAAAAEVVGSLPPMPGPGEPGPFSLADVDRVRRILDGAGFADVDVAPVTDEVTTSAGRVPELAHRSTRVGAVRELLRDADDDTRRRCLDAIEAALLRKSVDGEVRLSRAVLLVRARR